ncbi:hypothetical protein [Lonsdalea britannica]|uniref:hypothetical protein n=1 Tax=Lonsdalea britannica TaxID=1082704 RepID=UPI00159363A9|nr:hypothetical protein [Lonsdalea britannica]
MSAAIAEEAQASTTTAIAGEIDLEKEKHIRKIPLMKRFRPLIVRLCKFRRIIHSEVLKASILCAFYQQILITGRYLPENQKVTLIHQYPVVKTPLPYSLSTKLM